MTMIESSTRRDFRHTKIVCTLGPATSDTETLRSLANAGMNIARFNMSHGDHASHLALFEKVKGLNQVLNHPIGLLLDTQGPEIRTGERDSPLHLEVGAHITLTVSPEEDPEEASVHVKYPDLVNDLKVGDRVTVDNGLINLEVLEITAPRMRCKVIDGGKLGSRRHVNLPGIRVNLPSITDKDRADIEFGLKQGIDYIALSFVRSPDDIAACRKLVEAQGGTAKIYAKIENQEGMDNFDQILEAADGIMVARGDLGVEIPIRELPHSQRQMVRKCIVAAKPVIVATHLLESMINNPMPTRAEVSDVANAVYEGADAIMLSGETSAGQFPLRCVQTLDSIARRQEKEPMLGFHLERRSHGVRDKLARHAVQLAESLGSHAILVITRRGTTAQLVAAYRPSRAIIYAFTNQESVRNKLWMIRSVVPMHTDLYEDPEKTVQSSMLRLRERNRLLPGDPVVVVSDIEAGEERVTTIQVRKFR